MAPQDRAGLPGRLPTFSNFVRVSSIPARNFRDPRPCPVGGFVVHAATLSRSNIQSSTAAALYAMRRGVSWMGRGKSPAWTSRSSVVRLSAIFAQTARGVRNWAICDAPFVLGRRGKYAEKVGQSNPPNSGNQGVNLLERALGPAYGD